MDVALKEEKSDKNKKILKFEYEILKDLQVVKRIPKIFDFVENSTQNFIVMELLGENVANYKKNLNDFTEINAYDILLQMIETIKHIHDKGYIHRDIKPTNFVMSRDVPGITQKSVYMVDFGLAKIHLDKNGKPFPARLNTDFRGTLTYASLNAHLKKELSRRDDLWSFFFVILDLLNEDLPWRKCKDDKDEIRKRKEICLLYPEKNLFLSTTKGKTEIHEILNHLKSLKYEDRPDYEFIHNRIREMRSKELTRIFHQRYSSNVFSDSNFFFDFVKNNSNKLSNSSNHNTSNYYNHLQNYFANSNNNANNHNQLHNYGDVSGFRQHNNQNIANFNVNNHYYNNNNNNINIDHNKNGNNLGNDFSNNFSNYVCNIAANPHNQNFNNANAYAKDSEIYKLAYPNLGYNNSNYNSNNQNFNLAYLNQAACNGNANGVNSANIWPSNNLHTRKSEIGGHRTNHIGIADNEFYFNNNNFDFTNFGNVNNTNAKNTNYENIDVLKNLYLDQIELESNKRLKKEELFNLNNLKNNYYSNSLANQNALDANNAFNLYSNNNNNNIYDAVYNNINNNNNNFENSELKAKANDFLNAPLEIQQQNGIQSQLVSLPAEIISNAENDVNNFENVNNSNADLINNGNSREINGPDSDLFQSNKSKTNNKSLMENNNNNNNLESNEINLSNLTNGIIYSSNNNNNNNNNCGNSIPQIAAKVPSLFRKDNIFNGPNTLNINSNLAQSIHNNGNVNCDKKETLTKKKRARKNSSLNSADKKAFKDKSIAKNCILSNNNNNQNQINYKGKPANSKVTPISKSDFFSVNLNNNNNQVLSQGESDSPLIESTPVNLNLNKNINNNTNRNHNNAVMPANITNNNTNLSNNNQNQIFIINQYSKNNNLTELEKDLINYFLNYEAKNIPTTSAINSNINNHLCFNNSNNGNNNAPAQIINPLEAHNFDKILSKFLKENLLKQYIQSYIQNVIGNNMINNLNNANAGNFINPNEYMAKLDNANEQFILNSVLDILKNRNCNSTYLSNNNFNNNRYNVYNTANYLGLNGNRDKNNTMLDPPVALIFNKILEQSANSNVKNINTNLNNKYINLHEQKDSLSDLFSCNALNSNSNYNELLKLNLSNIYTNNICAEPNKLEYNLSNNLNMNNNNNNLDNFYNILNVNFNNEKHQNFDPRINLNPLYNQNYNSISSFNNNGNMLQNKSINEIPLKNKLKDPALILRPAEALDVDFVKKNNFLTSLLKNEENLNLGLSGQANTNKTNLFPSELPQVKSLNTIKKPNIASITNYNNNLNFNFPNNLDLNLSLNENKNLLVNDLENYGNAKSKRSYEDEFLLLKQEIELREKNALNLKNLIPQQQQPNKFLMNENFNGCIYNNNTNDPNYVLLYNLLKEDNNSTNVNGAINFVNN